MVYEDKEVQVGWVQDDGPPARRDNAVGKGFRLQGTIRSSCQSAAALTSLLFCEQCHQPTNPPWEEPWGQQLPGEARKNNGLENIS